jgi:hypothetical protein
MDQRYQYRNYAGLGFIGPSGVQGGASGSSGPSEYAVAGRWRQKANSGLLEIQVLDPDHPNRVIWVDAIWDAANDAVIPLDNKYRGPGNRYAIANMFVQHFADAAGEDTGGWEDTGGIVPGTSPPPVPSQSGANTGVILLVLGLLGVYVLTQ